jgi:type II secretory pathway pseudopilin PulG
VSAAGFTLVDTLLTATFLGIVAATAVPAVMDVSDSLRLGQGAREVERELQTARLRAVGTNRPIRVRFNCPAAGEYRMVELIGTPTTPAAADGALNRCVQGDYPYPPADQNPITVPNHDGPTRRLPVSVTFGAIKTLEFWPDGSVHADTGGGNPWPVLTTTGTAITVVKKTETKSITVNGLGKIQIQ